MESIYHKANILNSSEFKLHQIVPILLYLFEQQPLSTSDPKLDTTSLWFIPHHFYLPPLRSPRPG